MKKTKNYIKDYFKNSKITKKIEIRYGDFLNYNLPRDEKYKVFSNIPFNLTADIITKLTSATNPPENAYLIIQDEAAKKFAGLPYGKERQYSLLLKPWFELKILHNFKRTDFYPIPQVKIVLLQIRKRENPLIREKHTQLYRDFIVYGFNQWKLNLKSTLKKIFTYEQLKRLSKNLGFNLSMTATELNFNQWLELFNYFVAGVEDNKKALVYGAERILKRQQLKLQKVHRTRFKN